MSRSLLCFVVLLALSQSSIGAAEQFIGVQIEDSTDIRYPQSPFIVDVTKAPYFAKGDGRADDTEALQRALSDVMGQHKMLYLPAGTYLVSRTLMWSKQNSSGREAWGKNFVQGQNATRTVIQLKDSTFTDPEEPQSIMWCGGFGSADWFHNYVQDVTFDIGQGNSGAIALQFYSNNSGAVRNCRFVSRDGKGVAGLDLVHRDMNGPLLVRNCEIVGFERGIVTGRAVNSQTFEYITLRGQTRFGFENQGQSISVRGLLSENAVPAVQTYGVFCLIDSQLTGYGKADQEPAIINYNGGRIFLRDVATTGYVRAVADVTTPDSYAARRIRGPDKAGSEGPGISEYCSHPATSPFPPLPETTIGSLRLLVSDPPVIPLDDPGTWANVDDFGADPTAQRDSSDAIQLAMDSGAATVFLPGSYELKKTVVIGGKARRVIGVGGIIDYLGHATPDFRIVDGDSPAVSLEHFAYVHGGVEIDTRRTIVFRSVSDCDLTMTDRAEGGEIFGEDFVTHNLRLRRQRFWARQLNIENEGTHLLNDGSDVWVLGFKTERGGTLVETLNDGRSEILGGFSYTTTAGKLAPMFVTQDSSVFSFFNEVCFNGDPFAELIRETQKGHTRTIETGQGTTMPYRSGLHGSTPSN